MKSKYIKTSINQLVKKFGTRQAASRVLGISPRYVYMLQKKERKASPILIKLVRLLLEEKKNEKYHSH